MLSWGKYVGSVVGNILVIVDQSMGAASTDARDGILRSVVIEERVTELLDVDTVMKVADPIVSGQASAAGER